MAANFQTTSKILLVLSATVFCLGLTNCGSESSDGGDDGGIFDLRDDTDIAVELIHEANRNLKSIRALYNQNNPKVEELKKALNDKDIEKVRKLTDEISLVIIDGYVLAENAKEKIDKAKNLSDISDEFRQYLELKAESLDLQIKAFNYRRDSATLFHEEFGTEDTSKLDAAKSKFVENEKKFAEYINEAKKRNDQADKMWSESRRKS
jgi:hypothetical protein